MRIWGSITNLGIRDKMAILMRQYLLSPLRSETSIFRKALTHEIIEYYDGLQLQNADSKTGFLGFGLIHYALITNIRPKRILCIGSKKGFIPAMCAMACRDIQHGHVDFVDAGYGESDGKRQWGGIGLWKRLNAADHFSFLGLGQYITTYVMTTHDFFAAYRDRYDYIYIDGDHSYPGIKQDFLFAWPRLTKGGYMVFHDLSIARMPGQPRYGVRRLWKELKVNNKLVIHAEAGLGIIQKT